MQGASKWAHVALRRLRFKAAAVYFLLVFSMRFVFDRVSVLFVVPGIGARR